MTNKQKIEELKTCFEDTVWMAIRYADGRHTYAPCMVRDAVKKFQSVFPDWKPKEDRTLTPPKEGGISWYSSKDNYLHDLVSDLQEDE